MAVCRPICFAAANIRRVKASCTIGSPPEIVMPPSSARSAGANLPRRSMTWLAET